MKSCSLAAVCSWNGVFVGCCPCSVRRVNEMRNDDVGDNTRKEYITDNITIIPLRTDC